MYDIPKFFKGDCKSSKNDRHFPFYYKILCILDLTAFFANFDFTISMRRFER